MGNIPLRVMALKNSGTSFEAIHLFNKASVQQDAMVEKALRDFTLLDINSSSRSALLLQQPSTIKLEVPVKSGILVLMMYRENISPNGFRLMTNKGETFDHLNDIIHYRGMVEGDPYSVDRKSTRLNSSH